MLRQLWKKFIINKEFLLTDVLPLLFTILFISDISYCVLSKSKNPKSNFIIGWSVKLASSLFTLIESFPLDLIALPPFLPLASSLISKITSLSWLDRLISKTLILFSSLLRNIFPRNWYLFCLSGSKENIVISGKFFFKIIE